MVSHHLNKYMVPSVPVPVLIFLGVLIALENRIDTSYKNVLKDHFILKNEEVLREKYGDQPVNEMLKIN